LCLGSKAGQICALFGGGLYSIKEF